MGQETVKRVKTIYFTLGLGLLSGVIVSLSNYISNDSLRLFDNTFWFILTISLFGIFMLIFSQE